MENYIVAEIIKKLRERQGKTQLQLANEIFVSEKTISKWETGRGLPSIYMVESLAKALNISVIELLNGNKVENTNRSSNLLKSKFYVCPMCGNIITTIGEVNISCCGIKLIEEEYEEISNKENLNDFDGNLNFNMYHKMTKDDYITFVSYVTGDSISTKKLYPEQNCEVNFERNGRGFIYYYNNKNGLFRIKV